MKAIIRQLTDAHKLCVFAENKPYVASVYYDNIDEIDVTEVFRGDNEEERQFQLNFLRELRAFAKGFTISKSAIKAKQVLDRWVEELNLEPVMLSEHKSFDPNNFFWAWKFK